ncbi:MAG: 30S ribosome-binding factor RbfA [candidate division KSB1 bacterium]|nr:30S ribosome-binding factor RbfA [candidate division KSB1 bacterium]
MQSRRSLRVAELLKKEISHIIFTEIKDPRIGFITITRVTVSPDLKIARIYLSVIGDQTKREKCLQGLEKAKAFIRSELAPRTGLRYVPEIKFFYDDTFDYIENIDHLLKKVQGEQNSSPEYEAK